MRRVHLWVSGDVQGIGYRSFIKEKAFVLGLAGWVKNLPDGRVEVIIEGDPVKVGEMVNFCKVGPKKGVVKEVQELEEKPQGEKGFHVMY